MHWRGKWQATPVFLPGEISETEEPGGVYGVAQSRTRLEWLSNSSSTKCLFWKLDLMVLWRLHFINVIHVSYLLGHVSEESNKHHFANPWVQFRSGQLLGHVQLFAAPWTASRQASLLCCSSPTPRVYLNSCSLSSLSWWCHPTISSSVIPFSSCLQTSPSLRVISNESVLRIRWPKYWSFSFSISPSNEYSGLISFRMDWLDLLAVQGTQESSPTPQFKSINSLVLSFLYSPTLTSIHYYWKNCSFE